MLNVILEASKNPFADMCNAHFIIQKNGQIYQYLKCNENFRKKNFKHFF